VPSSRPATVVFARLVASKVSRGETAAIHVEGMEDWQFDAWYGYDDITHFRRYGEWTNFDGNRRTWQPYEGTGIARDHLS
jgi:hypothetical protein